MRFIPLLLPILLVLPMCTHAQTMTTWDMREPLLLQTEIMQLTSVEQLDEGLNIQTEQDGYILWYPDPIPASVDAIVLRVLSTKNTNGAWLWSTEDAQGDMLHREFFEIPASPDVQEIMIPIHKNPRWQWETHTAGIGLAAHSDLLLVEIDFLHHTLTDQIVASWKGFWTFDRFSLRSINFLWGPRLVLSTAALHSLFVVSAGYTWSAMYFFYAIIAFVILVTWILHPIASDKFRQNNVSFRIVIITIAGLWVLMDIRMGAELLSYARTDWKTYISAPPQERVLRTHKKLFSHIEEALPFIKQQKHFALLSNASHIFAAYRYFSYPSIPILQKGDVSTVHLWVVEQQSDVTLQNDHLVDSHGTVLTSTGHVIHSFSDDGFLFLTD